MKKIFDAFLFTSAFITLCAVCMVAQSVQLLHLAPLNSWYYLFVIGGTVASYNLHWYLTDFRGIDENSSIRHIWTEKHHNYLLPLAFVGLLIAAVSFWFIKAHWFWILAGSALAFLYTAPKIPGRISLLLRKIAVAKTIYLSLAWTYVTATLPLLVSGKSFTAEALYFMLHRFFFMYTLCILFDYRDREEDARQGIRSLITSFDEKGIIALFYFSVITGILFATLFSHQTTLTFLLSMPLLIVAVLFLFIKSSKNDYLYYFVIDGLMCVSFLFTCFQQMQ